MPKFRGSYILAVALVMVVCYFVVSFFNLKADVSEKAKAVAEISYKCRVQEDENKELEAMLNNNNIEEYVEKRARDEDLGYVMPNERVYYDVAGLE